MIMLTMQLLEFSKFNYNTKKMYQPLIYYLSFMQFDTILLISSREQLCGDRSTMLRTTATWIMFVQVMRKSIPTASNSNHYMGSQNLFKESDLMSS